MNIRCCKNLLGKLITVLLFLGPLGFSSAFAAGGYSSAPTDVASFQAQIKSSLVAINCTGFTTLGIVEKVATGVSNRIVTPSKSIASCPKGRNGSGFTVTNLISTNSVGGNLLYSGTGLASEYAWLISSTDAIPKFLNERKGPIVGGWLTIASLVSAGAPISWYSSSIQSIDLATSTMVITNSGLNIPKGGLVFDSRGTFLGIVSSVNTLNSTSLIVSGSPLRCKNIDETKIYSEVCLSSEGSAIIRSTLWPDNSFAGRISSNSRDRANPTPNPNDNPFGLKRDSNSTFRATPSARPSTSAPDSRATSVPSPKPSISASPKPTAVTCVKGKDVIPATGTPPTCPAGYRKK